MKNSQSVAKSSVPFSPKAKQDNLILDQSNLKSSAQLPNEYDQKRSTRKEVNYKESSGNSSSSVEYLVEWKHTDDESDFRIF